MSSGDNPRRGTTLVAPPPISADIGIVAAMPMEIAPLLERFKNVRKYAAKGQSIIEGALSGRLVAVVLTGMGRARAQRGAERLIDGHRPRWIVSAGFAGALNPDLPRNAVILPVDVTNVEGRHFATDWPEGVDVPPPAKRQGRLLTVDEIVLKAAQRVPLRTVHAADLVDMESSSIAALCAERGVRFLSIRIVSDDASTDLPPEILSIMGESGSYRIGAAIGAIWRRPSSLKDLLKLREDAMDSAERLTKSLLAILPELK